MDFQHLSAQKMVKIQLNVGVHMATKLGSSPATKMWLKRQDSMGLMSGPTIDLWWALPGLPGHGWDVSCRVRQY